MSEYFHVELLMTGDEVMSGDIVDTNSVVIAQALQDIQIKVRRKVTVPDSLSLLEKELANMLEVADVVIVNGGLGPTMDDLTAQAVANVLGRQLQQCSQAVKHLESFCHERNLKLDNVKLKQTFLPENSECIKNPMGTALGFMITTNRCCVICTPGVPLELKVMMNTVAGIVNEKNPNKKASGSVIKLQTCSIGESTVQQGISDSIQNWPDSVKLGFRSGIQQLEIKLIGRTSADKESQEYCKKQLMHLFGNYVTGEGDKQIEDVVVNLLCERKMTLTTAESCTGGLIASMLTRVSGASESFSAGLVTYSNDIKKELLNVRQETLDKWGAVSEEVVIEMANGALVRSKSDLVVAVTGIAGPSGGSRDKPVGTVWIAWGSVKKLRTCHLIWPTDRVTFQTKVAVASLDLIRRTLLGINELPSGFASM